MSSTRQTFNDGYDTTVVLDCGEYLRLASVPGLPDPKVGDWWACAVHSAVTGYDPQTGDPEHERDRRAVEVRREI